MYLSVAILFGIIVQICTQKLPTSCIQAQQLRFEITLAAEEASQKISLASVNITKTVTTAKLNIRTQLNALLLRARAAPERCNKQVVADIAELNIDSLDLCNDQFGLDELKADVEEIKASKEDVDQVCSACGLVGTCEKMEEIRGKYQERRDDVIGNVSVIEDNSGDCVKLLQRALLRSIGNVGATLDYCQRKSGGDLV